MKPFHVSLSTVAAFAALAVTATAETYNDAVIFGKVTLQSMPDASSAYLSVTIPTTAGATDDLGYGVRIWDLGTVQCGGVYDSFHNGGPGFFSVQNTGNYPAYVYVATGMCVVNRNGLSSDGRLSDFSDNEIFPFGWIKNGPGANKRYKLAVATDVTALVPTWRPLCWMQDGPDSWIDGTSVLYSGNEYYVGGTRVSPFTGCPCAFLAQMPVGETQLFDLKFWAPEEGSSTTMYGFVICIEAQAFKRWNHE